MLEMVVVISIVSMLLSAVSLFIVNSMGTYDNVTARSGSLNKLRYLMERCTKELRMVDYDGAQYQINTFSNTQFDFVNTDGVQVVFNYTPASDIFELSYSSPAVTATLADNISDFNFFFYKSDGSTLALLASEIAFVEYTATITEDGVSVASQSRVAFRDNQ